MILEVYPLGPLETNAILIGCKKKKKAAVIDAPCGVTSLVLERSKALSLTIDMLLLTHSHWDHIADAASFKDEIGSLIYVHPEDAGNLICPGQDRLPLFFPIRGVRPDRELSDGQIIEVGDLKIKVIHTPGHTPGCVCFYIESEGVLISGDTLFRGSMGNLSFPTARPSLMRGSLQKLARLPPTTKVYPGHGMSTTIGQEKWITQEV